MKPDDRVRALNAATVHLTWLTEKPYDRCATSLRLLADVDARATIAAGSRDDTGRRAVGGHSDPTAAAAGARVDAGASSRRLTDAIRYDIAELSQCAAFLRTTVCGCRESEHLPPSLRRALFNVGWLLTVPHSIGAWSSDDPETVREVDHAVDRMAHLSSILATRVRRVLGAAVRPPSEKPIERPRESCTSCARWGIVTDLEPGRYAKVCRNCGDFRANHKVLPTEAICRKWNAAIYRVTPGEIMEAKAAAKVRGKRKASA